MSLIDDFHKNGPGGIDIDELKRELSRFKQGVGRIPFQNTISADIRERIVRHVTANGAKFVEAKLTGTMTNRPINAATLEHIRDTVVSYDGVVMVAFEEYHDSITSRIQNIRWSIPEVDPLVVATKHALSQPKNNDWRRFQNSWFRIGSVEFVRPGDNTSTFDVVTNTGNKMVFPNDNNYANSGKTTLEWFIEHTLNLEPQQKP